MLGEIPNQKCQGAVFPCINHTLTFSNFTDMKRFLTLIALLVCSGGALHAQTFTSYYNDDSCAGHRFTYHTSLNGANSTQYSVEHSFGNGVKDTFSINYLQLGSYMAVIGYVYPSPGNYTTKAVLFQNATGARTDSVTQQIVNGTCLHFTGRIYADLNSNCAFNTGADSIMMMPVQIKVDSANIPIDTITGAGQWSYIKQNPNFMSATYKFTVLNPPAGYVSTCQTANSITVNYPSQSLQDNNFGYTCSGTAFDLSGWFTARMRTSIAGPSWIDAYYTNLGCPQTSGTVTLKVSPKYTITTAGVLPAPASVSNNLITWNFSGLHHGTVRHLYVPVVPTQLYTTNDTGCNTLTVNPITGDAVPANNVENRCDSLRASFDPNDKHVSPTGNVLAGTRLTYLINFENLGNDTAFNVHVLDTLSSTLDASSLQLISASHSVRLLDLAGPTGTRIMKFDFPNIRLADKTKPLYNKGFVRFSVKAKTGLANGTTIPNRAGIYFDFNPVVMTNTAMSTIGTPQGVVTLSPAVRNSIHPNPADDRLTITNASGTLTHAVLMTMTGQVARRWNLVAGENNVSLESLPAGLYLVQLHGASGVQVEKLEKR